MGYTKAAISGFSWQTILKILTSLVTIAKIYFLARLLSPTDFGHFSLTAIALGLTESLTQTGVNFTIVQSKQSVEYFLDTAWVISIFRGLIIGIVMALVGIGMRYFYDEPMLLFLVAIAAFTPIIKGFINPAIVKLHKNFHFFQESAYRFSLILFESVLAVLLTFWLKSVYGLILALIGSALFEVMVSFIFFKNKPRFRYLKSRGDIILNNAKWLSPATLLNYLNENMDDFLLGKIVGTYNLGLYHNAYSLSHKTNYDLAKSVHHGTIPIFTRIAHKQSRLTRAYFRSLIALIGISLLVSVPLFLFPKFVVSVLLGSSWLESIALVRPLVIAGFIQAISLNSYSLFMAKKDYLVLNIHLLSTLLLMTGLIIFLGLKTGLVGAVMGIAISRALTFPIIVWGVKRNI